MDLRVRTTPGAPVADHSWLAGDSAAFDNAQSGTLDVSEFTSGTHYDTTSKVMPAGVALAEVGGVLVPFAPAAEAQTIQVTGSPTGGDFALSVNGEVTGAIAYNADAEAVQTALEALSNIAVGDVTVTGTTTKTITFGGAYSGVNVPTILLADNGLTGGSSPSVTIASSAEGGSQDLFGFLAYPEPLLGSDGVLAEVAAVAVIVDATIIPSKLPVTAQRTIGKNTPTTGKFGFVNR
jgi:hypothetical protein